VDPLDQVAVGVGRRDVLDPVALPEALPDGAASTSAALPVRRLAWRASIALAAATSTANDSRMVARATRASIATRYRSSMCSRAMRSTGAMGNSRSSLSGTDPASKSSAIRVFRPSASARLAARSAIADPRSWM
jgi:hypothetical protein